MTHNDHCHCLTFIITYSHFFAFLPLLPFFFLLIALFLFSFSPVLQHYILSTLQKYYHCYSFFLFSAAPFFFPLSTFHLHRLYLFFRSFPFRLLFYRAKLAGECKTNTNNRTPTHSHEGCQHFLLCSDCTTHPTNDVVALGERPSKEGQKFSWHPI